MADAPGNRWSLWMSNALLLPLALLLMAYCGFYWTALTAGMIGEARRNRVKKHLDWTIVGRRGRHTQGGWRFW
jgi:hypothetical protein